MKDPSMKISSLRALLGRLGYHAAGKALPCQGPDRNAELAQQWLSWVQTPNRTPTALEIAGAPIITTLSMER